MKDKVLQALSETDGFLSGQQLSELLGVSRTAVWKTIGKLKDEGYEIEAVTNRGYRLIRGHDADIVNQIEVEKRLTTRWIGHPVIYEAQTGSTNDDIMRMADEGAPEGTLAVASLQTAGKGRRGRVWVSPDQGNVYMSLLLRPRIPVQEAPMMTLIMALAAYEALQDQHYEERIRFGIKWPNDLVASVDGGPYKKLAGILTEMRLEDAEIKDVTIGIGMNLNMEAVDPALEETATTLCRAVGKKVDRAQIAADCWNHFEKDYEEYLAAGSLLPLIDRYSAASVNLGRLVRVLDPQGEFTGTARAVTSEGELVVSPEDGSEDRRIGTGEVSVRGVMGYV